MKRLGNSHILILSEGRLRMWSVTRRRPGETCLSCHELQVSGDNISCLRQRRPAKGYRGRDRPGRDAGSMLCQQGEGIRKARSDKVVSGRGAGVESAIG